MQGIKTEAEIKSEESTILKVEKSEEYSQSPNEQKEVSFEEVDLNELQEKLQNRGIMSKNLKGKRTQLKPVYLKVAEKLYIINHYKRNSLKQTAKYFNLSPNTILRWISRKEEKGIEGLEPPYLLWKERISKEEELEIYKKWMKGAPTKEIMQDYGVPLSYFNFLRKKYNQEKYPTEYIKNLQNSDDTDSLAIKEKLSTSEDEHEQYNAKKGTESGLETENSGIADSFSNNETGYLSNENQDIDSDMEDSSEEEINEDELRTKLCNRTIFYKGEDGRRLTKIKQIELSIEEKLHIISHSKEYSTSSAAKYFYVSPRTIGTWRDILDSKGVEGLRASQRWCKNKIPKKKAKLIHKKWINGAKTEKLMEEYGVTRHFISYIVKQYGNGLYEEISSEEEIYNKKEVNVDELLAKLHNRKQVSKWYLNKNGETRSSGSGCLSLDEKLYILSQVKKTKDLNLTARYFNLSIKTILAWKRIKKLKGLDGLKLKSSSKSMFTREKEAQILDKWVMGASNEELMKEFGLTKHYVSTLRFKIGIKLNKIKNKNELLKIVDDYRTYGKRVNVYIKKRRRKINGVSNNLKREFPENSADQLQPENTNISNKKIKLNTKDKIAIKNLEKNLPIKIQRSVLIYWGKKYKKYISEEIKNNQNNALNKHKMTEIVTYAEKYGDKEAIEKYSITYKNLEEFSRFVYLESLRMESRDSQNGI